MIQKHTAMKKFKTTATWVLATSTMMFLQGCIWPTSYSNNSYSGTATTVTYHFNPAEYFSKQDRKYEMPFWMNGGNISSALLNAKESFIHPENFKRVNLSVALNSGGGSLRFAYATKKKFVFMANYSPSTKNDVAKGSMITNATITSTPMTYGWSTAPNANSTSWESKEAMPYTIEHNRSQTDYEFAAGRYAFIGTQGLWESFAGLGITNAENKYNYSFGDEETTTYYSTHSSNHFNESFSDQRAAYKIFLQNNIGYLTRATEGALGSRFTYLHFTKQEFKSSTPISNYEMMRGALLFEPSVHFGIGFNNFKLYSEYAWAIPVGGSDVKWDKKNFRFGASLTF